ncbi:EAL domain-containing protein [Paenisporosarcina sp. TG20]|uniref:EAL domain-containing protein n=1 Tax=Paenisporosarcina sp. TG20 TaxID=1211706 RepID=UPI0002EB5B8A|nr:EAL domain-containing protein [Paenisporosarcina sp. TG20]
MNSCIHCGISFDFYNKGFIFIESKQIRQHITSKYQISGGNIAYAPYSSLDTVENELNRLSHVSDIKIGLSRSTRHERLIDLKTFKFRFQEKETVNFIQHGQLVSHLQPIVSLHSKEVYGYESLLRTKDSEISYSPMSLFNIAAKTGLHSLLDQRAREAAIKARDGNIPIGKKSFINFLPSTIYNPDFCLQHTFKLVEKYKVNPQDLVFEVVETEKINDVLHLKKVLDRYKKEGMKVALDDVGSGYSTLDMLELLRPDYVKIDRSYVTNCDQDSTKQAFLKEANKRAHALGIITLAEGIERIEEAQVCESLGYDLAQGYLFGKPSETTKWSNPVSANSSN